MATLSEAEVLRQLGASPQEVDRQLQAFSKAARVLSSDHPRLIDEHPLQWVGIYDGHVAASARNLKSLMAQLENEGIPAADTIIRFIDKEERVMVL